MHFLEPIYQNNTGAAYALKSSIDDPFSKIQLQLGDIAILMDMCEVESFLTVVKSAQKGCNCANCEQEGAYKIIKCDTAYAEVKFKATPRVIEDLEDLVNGIIFEVQVNRLLGDNNIM